MTKEQFENAANTLNKDGVAGFSAGTWFSGRSPVPDSLIRQLGGAVSNDAGTQATYNSDAGDQEALQYVLDLKNKYSPTVSGAGDPKSRSFNRVKPRWLFMDRGTSATWKNWVSSAMRPCRSSAANMRSGPLTPIRRHNR